MIEALARDDVVYAAGVLLVTAIVLGRLYVGEHYFNDQSRFWGPLRRRIIPLLHRLMQSSDGDYYAETDVSRDEHVATIPLTPRNVMHQLAEAGFEPQPLASLATDWKGRTEVASWARYEGPKPFPGAPDFLRPRQIHVRLFASEGGAHPSPVARGPSTVVTAHEEATSWRPDLWRDHYRGETLNVDLGVELAADALDIRLEETHDP